MPSDGLPRLAVVLGGLLTTSNAAIGYVLIDSAASVVPGIGRGPHRVLALLVLYTGLAAVNIAGVRQGIAFAVISTAGKLLPLLFLIGGGVIVMSWQELRWTGWPAADKLGEASIILFFAFQGAEAALTPSAEIRDPERNVPPAIFAATACVILIYFTIHAVSQGVLGEELARQTGVELPTVGERIAGTAGRSLIMAGTAISILFLVAQDGLLPAPLAAVHPRYRTARGWRAGSDASGRNGLLRGATANQVVKSQLGEFYESAKWV